MKFPKYTISQPRSAFTLVELLTVIAIIAVLMGLLFPTVGAVKESARKAQAKNDVTQLVTAVKAYYTEYGKYPCKAANSGDDSSDYRTDNAADWAELIQVLQGINTSNLNPRRIVFFEGTVAKETGRYGIQTDGSGNPTNFLDPWGKQYKVRFDNNYNNTVKTPDGKTIRTGVIAWSTGKDGNFDIKDDPVSWQ